MVRNKFEIFKNSRLVLGLSVLLIAVFSAGLISREANRTVQVWAASSSLSPGSFISEKDIQKVSVLLPDSSKNYISVKAQIVGANYGDRWSMIPEIWPRFYRPWNLMKPNVKDFLNCSCCSVPA